MLEQFFLLFKLGLFFCQILLKFLLNALLLGELLLECFVVLIMAEELLLSQALITLDPGQNLLKNRALSVESLNPLLLGGPHSLEPLQIELELLHSDLQSPGLFLFLLDQSRVLSHQLLLSVYNPLSLVYFLLPLFKLLNDLPSALLSELDLLPYLGRDPLALHNPLSILPLIIQSKLNILFVL